MHTDRSFFQVPNVFSDFRILKTLECPFRPDVLLCAAPPAWPWSRRPRP